MIDEPKRVPCQICKKLTAPTPSKTPGITVEVCPACYWPKRYARCECGGIKNVKSARCTRCVQKVILEQRIQYAEESLQAMKNKLKRLLEEPS